VTSIVNDEGFEEQIADGIAEGIADGTDDGVAEGEACNRFARSKTAREGYVGGGGFCRYGVC